jgi:hypothetical protein
VLVVVGAGPPDVVPDEPDEPPDDELPPGMPPSIAPPHAMTEVMERQSNGPKRRAVWAFTMMPKAMREPTSTVVYRCFWALLGGG